ncbi:uncharacterized protein LOC121240871 [Juglans microcarpa x Juglans regia]|uniref:uncharacterized protein LOC121240871 n=1 Tax=Juglans microcarpa x Juglans regia TaxID=2249226 RepID=UPI001B7E06DB|nr:uncharacterized protein LOC121240871 [Juglans microcarpa x Juglans regia]
MGRTDVVDEDKNKMQHELRNLMDKYEEMTKKVRASCSVDQILTSTNLPYSAEVIAMPLPPKFRVPQINLYNGAEDPLEHPDTFKAHMTLHRFLGKIAYRAFPLILKGTMQAWFASLAPKSFYSFEDLAGLFITQLMASRRRRHLTAYLLTIEQQEDKSLKAYLVRFNKERMTTDDQDEKITLATLLSHVGPQNPFMAELARKTPATLWEFMDQADGFINVKDTLQALTAPGKMKLDQADRKVKTSAQSKTADKAKRGHRNKGGESR